MSVQTQKIDWNRVWKETMSLKEKKEKRHSIKWENKSIAKKFWTRTQKNADNTKKTLDEIPLKKSFRVIDIGSGPGRLTIPISKRVNHVTAVEPAKGMRQVLIENLKKENIKNVDCVAKSWEDIDINKDLSGPYDVSIAAFSLGVPDIKEAIEKIISVTNGYVFLYWFCGSTPWDDNSSVLWPLLYGEEYTPGPKADVIYNVLYDMGIYPDMHVFEMDHTTYFPGMEEAVSEFKSQFDISTDQQEEILIKYLKNKLVYENEQYIDKASSIRVRISWKTNH